MPNPHPVIVVGYDGTPASRAAVVRGLERVQGGGRLVLVCAYRLSDGDTGGALHGARLEDAADDAARTIDALAAEEDRLAFVDWERVVHEGDPAEVVCRVAADRGADEIVIGTRGLDRVGVLLGGVAVAVLHRADRPVTVIPARMLER